jgi:hypothetical protein
LISEKIAEIFKELREKIPGVTQDVGAEKAISRSYFDKEKWRRAAQNFPHLAELTGQELPENGMNARTGEIIAFRTDDLPRGVIIAVQGVVENQIHEFGKGYALLAFNPGNQKIP